MEIWKPVVGYDGLYEVSTYGRVRSLYLKTRIGDQNEKILKQKVDNRGYYRVNLHKNNSMKSYLVSRLVASAFIENPHNLPHVGHNDDNKTNNVLSNLYWTNPKENNSHNGKLLRFHDAHREHIAEIARKLSIPVKATSLSDGKVLIFESMQAARKQGFSSEKISLCVNNKRKSHKGYRWERN